MPNSTQVEAEHQVFQPTPKTDKSIFAYLLLHSFISGFISVAIFAAMVIYTDSRGDTDAGFALIAAPFVAIVFFVLSVFLGLISIGLRSAFRKTTKQSDLITSVYARALLMLVFSVISILES